MSSHAAQFASIPEMINYLARTVTNRHSLRELCLASKDFNAAFTPFLYAELWIRDHNSSVLVENLPVLLGNPALRYTRKLDKNMSLNSHEKEGFSSGAAWELYNEAALSLLLKMPELEVFRYVFGSIICIY
jgi:hypothetical protein